MEQTGISEKLYSILIICLRSIFCPISTLLNKPLDKLNLLLVHWTNQS